MIEQQTTDVYKASVVMAHPLRPEEGAKKTASIDQVRITLTDMLAAGHGSQAIEMALAILSHLSSELEDLASEVAQLKKLLFGKKSEKVSPDQLDMFAAMLVTMTSRSDREDANPESGQSHSPESGHKTEDDKDKKPRARRRRSLDPERIIEVKVPEEERACGHCGNERSGMGCERTIVIQYHPGRFEVLGYDREKLVCRTCEGEISVAPAPLKLMDGSPAGIGLASDIVARKYVDGMPLNRIRKAYSRLGMSFSLQNINQWESYTYEVFKPIIALIHKEVRSSDVIHLDDTGLKVRDRKVKGDLVRGHLWVFVGKKFDPGGALHPLQTMISFISAPTREAKYAEAFLADSKAIRQGDAFQGNAAGLETLARNGDLAVLAGCLMHARRYFFRAFDAGDPAAGLFLSEFAKIYKVEERAKAEGLNADQRLSVRKTHSLPIMQAIKERCGELRKATLPKFMNDATRYFVNQWEHLIYPFLHDGRLEIDNGEAERAIKPIACGRRAWLFAGSPEATHKIAGMFSLVQTALAAGLNPEHYLRELLARLVRPRSRLDLADLLPHRIAMPKQGA
jgi:transposase